MFRNEHDELEENKKKKNSHQSNIFTSKILKNKEKNNLFFEEESLTCNYSDKKTDIFLENFQSISETSKNFKLIKESMTNEQPGG